MMVDYRIAPTADEHVEELQAAIDAVARERRYLAAVSGFPLEQTRQFVASVAAAGGVQHVALDDGSVVGWCDIQRNPFEGFPARRGSGHWIAAWISWERDRRRAARAHPRGGRGGRVSAVSSSRCSPRTAAPGSCSNGRGS